MGPSLALVMVALSIATLSGCPALFGEPVRTVESCRVWRAMNTESRWLTARTSLAEVDNYLREKKVRCADEILGQLQDDERRGGQLWRFRNPGNSPPAVVDGYASVRTGDVVTSFYKVW